MITFGLLLQRTALQFQIGTAIAMRGVRRRGSVEAEGRADLLNTVLYY